MRALILILNADPFATIRLPPLGFIDRGTRLRAQLMPPAHVQALDVHASHGTQRAEMGKSEREKTWGCTPGQQPHMDFNS